MRTRLPLLVFVLLFGIPATSPAQTQITTGAIQGTAADETGAPLPGVTIEARNVGTNLTRTQVTAADGRYVFLQLPPGTYRLAVGLYQPDGTRLPVTWNGEVVGDFLVITEISIQ